MIQKKIVEKAACKMLVKLTIPWSKWTPLETKTEFFFFAHFWLNEIGIRTKKKERKCWKISDKLKIESSQVQNSITRHHCLVIQPKSHNPFLGDKSKNTKPGKIDFGKNWFVKTKTRMTVSGGTESGKTKSGGTESGKTKSEKTNSGKN